MLERLKQDRADLWMAERSMRRQLEVCVVAFVAARALRLMRWNRTANVLAKGSGLAIASGSIYMQVGGQGHLQERVAKFYTDASAAENPRSFVGGERWQELGRWAEACGCLHPFPISRENQDLACLKGDLESDVKEDLSAVVKGWVQPEELPVHRGLLAANLGRTAILACILLRLG